MSNDSTELLKNFIGGELEIQYGGFPPESVIRGPIRQIEYDAERQLIIIKMKWIALMEPFGTAWRVTQYTYLEIPSEVSLPAPDSFGRVVFPGIEQLWAFFPPNGSKLSPAKVKGLSI